MKRIYKAWQMIRDFYEVNLSAILLTAVVALFCAQIFIRYVVNGNTFYVYELSIIAFGWTSIAGASYGFRRQKKYGDGHVRFSILSDLLKGKAAVWLQIILSLITTVGMLWMFVPCCKTVLAYKISKTTILSIPFSYIYFPFLIFLLFSVSHEIENIVFNLKQLYKPEADKASAYTSEISDTKAENLGG